MTDAYRSPPRKSIIVCGGAGKEGIKGIHAIDIDTGDPLWSTPIEEHMNEPTMAIGSGRVAVVAGEGTVYCVARDTGQPLWSAKVSPREGGNTHEPLIMIAEERVFVQLQWVLTCFTADGAKLWERDAGVSAMGTEDGVVEYHG